MVPSRAWTRLSSVACTSLTVAHRHTVVIVSICALRIYRGLVDSTVICGPVQGELGATRPPSIRFVRSDFHQENTPTTWGAVLDPRPQATASPKRIYA